ncbi:MAG: NepR family anti-sigma factor [Roseiarcus sp.]|jgi:anti-sigma factor NepR-like protein
MVDKKKSGAAPGVVSPTPGGRDVRLGAAAKEHGRLAQTPVPAARGGVAPEKQNPAEVKDHIGRQLRALYDEVASQPVPDRFMELLNRLDVKRGDE